MTYSTIDGDISDFFDAAADLAGEFRTDELRTYLLNEGHGDLEVRTAVVAWQEDRFQRASGTWERFKLTPTGLAAVKELRAR